MRIGIVTPVIMYRDFAKYFTGNDRDYLESLTQNENGPAPSVITEGIMNEGHFVRVFTFGSENRVCRSEKIDIVTINVKSGIMKYIKLGDIRTAYQFYRFMKPNIYDLDLLHSHWTYFTTLAAGQFSKSMPVFCTVRDWAPVIRSFLPHRGGLTWKVRYIINEINFYNKRIHFIGNSPYTQALINNKLRRKDTPSIMNPINDAFIKKDEKLYPSNLKMICISSSIDARKNIGNLLMAYKQLKVVYPDCLLTCIFGNKDIEQNSFYQEWQKIGLLKDVRILLGVKHNDVFQLVDESTLMVNPSLEETFGNTIIECMARKTLVIAGKDAGAIPYLIGANERGILCDVSSVDSIVQTIRHTYENLESLKSIADAAYTWCVSNNTLKPIAEAHINYFSKYIKNGNRSFDSFSPQINQAYQ